MATENPASEITSAPPILPDPVRPDPALLVLLSAMPLEQTEQVLTNLTASFPAESLLIATSEALTEDAYPGMRFVPVTAAKASLSLTASDFVNAYQLAEKNGARAILILGQESASLRVSALRDLANAILESQTDLAVPRYELPSNAGLINSAILYPLTRALIASRARFPLAIDLGLSLRMAERLAAAAQRFTSANQGETLLWPVNEAAVAGFAVHEVDAGPRVVPQPTDPDINTLLASVTGSLFADIEAKAAYWQRPRQLPPSRSFWPQISSTDGAADITAMLDAFRLAYSNLQEIWSLVLPPNSLLGLKRLSVTEGSAFRMPDNLWARIVFDFLIAYRLRTINRGHLLGALIPLYLAWVAGHINVTASGIDPERHIEAVATAFEADKPYLVARWRWPDRFNP
jgi:glucosylglycerate synthase